MMKSAQVIIFLLSVTLLPVMATGSDYTLFSPRPLEGELLLPERGKGVLVRRIIIKPGDTLSKLSRDFSGRGSYFPQILLFNNIHNPDLIRAGNELYVPITRQDALDRPAGAEKKVSEPVTQEISGKQKPVEVKAVKTEIPAEKPRRKSVGRPAKKKQLPTIEQPADKGEQYYYSMALSAYQKDDFKKSLALFGRFLELYPDSALAPDASLYKAESLLKLSAQ